MKTRYLALTAVLAAGLLAGCGSSDDDEGDTTTLHVVEHADSDTLQHVGPADEKDSVGDVLGFANDLYDGDNANKVGTDNGSCIRTEVGVAFECVWTAQLEAGQLTVEGPFYDSKDSTLAITGGTGEYNDASGQMALHARNPDGTEYDFTYEIVK